MPAKTRFIIVNMIGLVGAIVFFVLSRGQVTITVLDADLSYSPGLLVFLAYTIGALVGASSMVPFLQGKQVENVAKLKEWQQQDAKLAVEVQSDKEKQLEAKIATLETALKQALKKES